MAKKPQKVFILLSGTLREVLDGMAGIRKADSSADVVSFTPHPPCCLMEARKANLPKGLIVSSAFSEA